MSFLAGNGDGTFQTNVDDSMGGLNPISITAGDFNGDGKIDLATASHGLGIMSVFIGNGDGTYQERVDYNASYWLWAITTGDFNGDGKIDLATANYIEQNFSIFLGNGDGTFQEKIDHDTGGYTMNVTAGDFNDDGKSDVAIGTYHGYFDLVTILIGNGDGTFQTKVDYQTGESAFAITTGDFNSDNKTDLAVANFFGASILIGNGDGTFQNFVFYLTGDFSRSIITGEFNNDEKADLAVGHGGTVSILIGNGDGTFQKEGDYLTSDAQFIAEGDFNNDGKTDLATVNRYSKNVSILINISNRPPVANAGSDQLIECAGPSGVSVTLDESGSYDPDGDPLTYTWTWPGGSATGVRPTIQLPIGATVVTLAVSDAKATASATVNITVRDTTPPITTATGGSANWYNMNVISLFTSSDSCSGVKDIHYIIDGSEIIVAGSSASVAITTDGIHNISYFSTDNAGNAETPKSMTVMIDKTPPSSSVVIENDAFSTISTTVIHNISATDNLSGVSHMRLSEDGTNWTILLPYSSIASWTFSRAIDPLVIYAQFMDLAGNISAVYSDAIYLDTDNDGTHDSIDNCPLVSNDQADRNGNGIGDACDGDVDGDTIVDIRDNCPTSANLDQADADGDEIGDACDPCINDATNACAFGSQLISLPILQPVTVSNVINTASVTVESGDIPQDTTITVSAQTNTGNFAYGANQQVMGAIYTFTASPSSTFTSTVTLVLKYDQGTMAEGKTTEDMLDIYYYDPTTLRWVAQNAIQDMANNTLTAEVPHFSNFAVIMTENPINDLIAAFKGTNAADGSTWEHLMNQLTKAYNEYEGGDNEDVKNDLKTFINKLESESRVRLGHADADMLIRFANVIIARL